MQILCNEAASLAHTRTICEKNKQAQNWFWIFQRIAMHLRIVFFSWKKQASFTPMESIFTLSESFRLWLNPLLVLILTWTQPTAWTQIQMSWLWLQHWCSQLIKMFFPKVSSYTFSQVFLHHKWQSCSLSMFHLSWCFRLNCCWYYVFRAVILKSGSRDSLSCRV